MLKPFIIAALSADGFIARHQSDRSTEWTSKEDKKNFVSLTKRAEVVIMGSKTFRTIGKPLPGRHLIVYSRAKKYHSVEVTAEEPEVLLNRLARAGYAEAAICGGASIYTLFMERRLVDKMYLTVESKIFGQGIPLFTKSLTFDLVLLATKQLSPNTLLLEYKVMR